MGFSASTRRKYLGRYLVIAKNCVSRVLNDVIVPPIQNPGCMKILWPFHTPSMIKEDKFRNFFRLAC